MGLEQIYLSGFQFLWVAYADAHTDSNGDACFAAGSDTFGSSNEHSKWREVGLYRVGVSACVEYNHCELQRERQRHLGHKLFT